MKTAVINIKTDPKLKKQAQEIASNMGLSLSVVMVNYLKKFVQEKSIDFSAPLEPSDYLLESIKKSEKELSRGEVSPTFDNVEDAIAWLNDPNAKYEG